MSTRASQFSAQVVAREQVSDHLVRLVLGGLDDFVSTGVADEWVGLVVPGQFQSRYYTVRRFADGQLTLDVVVHDVGLVTEWAKGECVGDTVTVTEPKASFTPPGDSTWLLLVGDLTAMPAIARICETHPDLDVRVWAETPDDLTGYLPDGPQVTWLAPPGPGASALAEVVEGIEWPEGPGYFWMAGESAQMRAIRKHLMRDRKLASDAYDVMGYWRGVARRQPRAVDPGPIYAAGKAAGKTDQEIWADYDAAQES
ncbi:MAG: siderophore-interacting protein [Nocardioides sp.]|uniref:siderophore-interacting protein n=1 Tax=Nocardioides sp. TaxID=35761 RepID=UPI003F098293